MKIMHIVSHLGTGGKNTIVKYISECQYSLGHDVAILGLTKKRENYFFDRPDAVELGKSGISLLKKNSHHELLEKIQEFCPDIVHSHDATSDIALAELRGRVHFRQVTHFHTYEPVYREVKIDSINALKREVGRRTLLFRQRRSGVHYISVSSDVSKYYENNCSKWMLGRHHIIENFCRIPQGAPRKFDKIKDGKIKLLSVGRLSKEKNLDFLIKVLWNLDKNYNLDVSLRIAGDGPDEARLKNLAASLGVSGKVVFLGQVRDIVSEYDKSDIFVHTSTSETFGLVIIEAMARGLPCLVNSHLLPVRDILCNGKFGVMESVGDLQKFTKTIVQMALDRNNLQKLSKLSIDRSRDFSLPKYMDSIERVYSHTLSS